MGIHRWPRCPHFHPTLNTLAPPSKGEYEAPVLLRTLCQAQWEVEPGRRHSPHLKGLTKKELAFQTRAWTQSLDVACSGLAGKAAEKARIPARLPRVQNLRALDGGGMSVISRLSPRCLAAGLAQSSHFITFIE